MIKSLQSLPTVIFALAMVLALPAASPAQVRVKPVSLHLQRVR